MRLHLLESPQKRISQVLRRQASLEEKAVRDQLRLLTQMRKYVLGEIADASGYQSFHLSQLLGAIDRYVDRVRNDSASALSSDTSDIFALGHELVDAPLAAAGIDVGAGDSLTGVSSELLNSAIKLTSGEMSDVFAGLGNGLKSSIRRAALGAQSPADVTAAVARLVSQKRNPFTTAEYDAERIVRTETNRVFGAATFDRMKQSNKALGGGLKKYWLSAGDSRVRDDHQQAAADYGPDGAIDVDKPFIVAGENLQFPLDPRGSASNTINCFLPGTIIGGRIVAASKAFYTGAAWRIETARGHALSVTANHPVLTNRGWLPAHEIKEGDYLLGDPGEVQGLTGPRHGHVDDEHPEAAIDQVFQALAAHRRPSGVMTRCGDFHGDAQGFREPQVDVVAVDREVLNRVVATLADGGDQIGLIENLLVVGAPLLGERAVLHLDGVGLLAAPGGIRGGDLASALGLSHAGPFEPLLLGRAAQYDARCAEEIGDECARSPEVFGELEHGLAGLVTADRVIAVTRFPYSGPVFDVQTAGGWVHSNGIVSHNCRCRSVPAVASKAMAA